MDINLAALRKYDGSVTRVIFSGGHVAVYDYDSQNKEWQKSGVEGALFICQCEGDALYKLFVLNRLNLNNLMLPVDSRLSVVERNEFIFYRRNGVIGGIWFFHGEEREKVINCMNRLKDLSSVRKPSESRTSGGGGTAGSSDIMSLLQSAYNKYLAEQGRPLSPSRDAVSSGGEKLSDEELNCLAEAALGQPSTNSFCPLVGGKTQREKAPGRKGATMGSSNSVDVSSMLFGTAAANAMEIESEQLAESPSPLSSYCPESINVEHRLLTDRGKESFRRALITLIKNDNDFCEKLYSSYLEAMGI